MGETSLSETMGAGPTSVDSGQFQERNLSSEIRAESFSASATISRDRWGSDAVLIDGYMLVPNLFLRHYGTLRPPLTTEEAMFVLEVLMYKRGNEHPFPSYKTVAKSMNVTDKMARRYAQKLEAKGYLRRIPRNHQTNEFDLSGLLFALERIATRRNQDGFRQRKKAFQWGNSRDEDKTVSNK